MDKDNWKELGSLLGDLMVITVRTLIIIALIKYIRS